MYLAVGLAYAVESSRHEGVVLNSVAEYNELCSTDAVAVGSALGSFLDYLTHELDCVHVDTGLGRADIYGRADILCYVECLRDRADKSFVAGRKSLMYECRIAAYEVYSAGIGCTLERLCKFDRIFPGTGCCEHSDRCNGYSLVNYRDTVFLLYLLTGLNELACL